MTDLVSGYIHLQKLISVMKNKPFPKNTHNTHSYCHTTYLNRPNLIREKSLHLLRCAKIPVIGTKNVFFQIVHCSPFLVELFFPFKYLRLWPSLMLMICECIFFKKNLPKLSNFSKVFLILILSISYGVLICFILHMLGIEHFWYTLLYHTRKVLTNTPGQKYFWKGSWLSASVTPSSLA